MSRGKYIVIEGPQGAGKTLQAGLLAERFRLAGLPVRLMREPDSQTDLTARTIRQITQDPRYPMNTRTEVLLYNAARSQSLEVIRHSINNGVYCVVDRNYLTTLAVQYYGRGDIPDYNTIKSIIDFAVNDMEPDLTIILDAPADTLAERSGNKRTTGERFDSLGEEFLERVRAGYLWEANQRNLPIIFATKTVDKVSEEVWNQVLPVLAKKTPEAKSNELASIKEVISERRSTLSLTADKLDKDQLIEKIDNHYIIKPKGKDFLKDVLTSSDDNVYAFTNKLSPVTISAAMARLSRRGDDMRVTILDEFTHDIDRDKKLLQRVITAYGDDSVQQLSYQNIVVEDASNLLTKKIEWGRLSSYLEQSTRYIFFDKKDENGHYKYYIPSDLKPLLKKIYTTKMNKIFNLYSEIINQLTAYTAQTSKTPENERDGAWRSSVRAQACDAARSVLPVATKSTIGISGSSQSIESLISHLQSDELPEAREVGAKILKHVREVAEVFFERADDPKRGGAVIAYRANTKQSVKKIANEYLPESYDPLSEDDEVQLVNYWPKNELDLVPDMLYEHSNLPIQAITDIASTWSMKKKTDAFNAYIGERLNRRHRPGRALEQAHYTWDIICDYGIFRDLQRHRMVDCLQWQMLSPRYGYNVPKLIEDAGLSDKFIACFDESLELYSTMQKEGYINEAQYAMLLGHKMRWQITYNAREAFHIHELRTSPQGHPEYRKLVKILHDKLTEVHPLIGTAMIFVNQGEDPELTRLAAERYSQLKLSQLK